MSERRTVRNMEIVLIRHGATAGNIEKRYIGTTDEPLCDTGMVQIQEYMRAGCYPQVQALYVSPLKRCSQTAAFIYSDMKHSYIVELKYAKYRDSENRVEELRQEAIAQANRYADTDTVKQAIGSTQLHKIVVVYKGMEMRVCEEL